MVEAIAQFIQVPPPVQPPPAIPPAVSPPPPMLISPIEPLGVPDTSQVLSVRRRSSSVRDMSLALQYGDVRAEGTRFQIGHDVKAYAFSSADDGMAVQGPGMQTICKELSVNAGQVGRPELFSTRKGQLRVESRPADQPRLMVVSWGDATLLCFEFRFKHGEEECIITGSDDCFIFTRGPQILRAKQLILDFERDAISVDGAASLRLPK
jgi:hypothetical protein